jgi:hypothetical protein
VNLFEDGDHGHWVHRRDERREQEGVQQPWGVGPKNSFKKTFIT